MKFKSSSEARAAIAQNEKEVATLNSTIEKRSAEAKDESLTVEARDLILADLEKEIAKRDVAVVNLNDAVTQEEDLVENEKRQFGILANVSSEKVAKRQKSVEWENDVVGSLEYRDAWIDYIKSGNETVVRAMTTGLTGLGNGGVVIPTEIADRIETEFRRGGAIARLCRSTSAQAYLTIPYEKSATGADWHEENTDALPQEEIEFDVVSIVAQHIKKWILVTDELEAMDNDKFIDYLIPEIMDKILVAQDDAIIGRSGTKGIIGITKATFGVERVPVSDFNFATGFSAMAVLDYGREERATVVMNRKTYFNTVMQLKDTTGQPIYHILNDATGKPQYFYGGMPVEFSSALPEYTDTLASGTEFMIVGDFIGYQLNYPKGSSVEIIRDALSLAEKDLVKYVGKLFVGGNVIRPKAFAVVTKA